MATETHTASNVKIAKLRDEVESLRLEKEEWKKAYFETSASWVKSQKEGAAEILRLRTAHHGDKWQRECETCA